jgi:hypothetical protein
MSRRASKAAGHDVPGVAQGGHGYRCALASQFAVIGGVALDREAAPADGVAHKLLTRATDPRSSAFAEPTRKHGFAGVAIR